MTQALAVAILAGGHSKRMGSDKSFALLDGRPLLEHVIEHVTALDLPLILIANDVERYQPFGLPVFSDLLPEKGSLGGIYTAISVSQAEYTLCVACDMPFLNPALLGHLVSLRQDYAAVVPRVANRAQGLHALYQQTCAPALRSALDQDRLRIGEFLQTIRTRYVEEDDLRLLDPDLRSFTNMNTPEELRSIRDRRS